MGSGHQTPDRAPGTLLEEAILLEETAIDPENPGEIRNVNGSLRFREAAGVIPFDLAKVALVSADGNLLVSRTGGLLLSR